jgi:hypothetical protein
MVEFGPNNSEYRRTPSDVGTDVGVRNGASLDAVQQNTPSGGESYAEVDQSAAARWNAALTPETSSGELDKMLRPYYSESASQGVTDTGYYVGHDGKVFSVNALAEPAITQANIRAFLSDQIAHGYRGETRKE